MIKTRPANDPLAYFNVTFAIERLRAEIEYDWSAIVYLGGMGEATEWARPALRHKYRKIARACRRFLRHAVDAEERAVVAAHLVRATHEREEV